MVIAAVDIGYRNTKMMFTDETGTQHQLVFPSLALPATFDGQTELVRRETRRVEAAGATYEVGPDIELLQDLHTALVLHQDYLDTPQYTALFHGALSYMGQSQIDLLAVGLPVEYMATRREDLIRKTTGPHFVPGLGKVEVRRTIVVPQPFGALVDHLSRPAQDAPLVPDANVLVVDPGFFTFDWLVARGLKFLPQRSGSFPSGISHALRGIADAIAADIGQRIEDMTLLDRCLRSGTLRIHGETMDMEAYLPAARQRVEHALRALKNKVGTGTDIEAICIAGGGASLFAPMLEDLFPYHDVQVLPDPVLANVRGFLLAAQDYAATHPMKQTA